LAERLTDEEPKREFSLLREFVTIAASVVIPLGLVIYGISSITYSAFYSTLSVDPSTVGFDYIGTLTHATGLIIVLSFGVAGVLMPILRRRRHTATGNRRRQIVAYIGIATLIVSLTLEFAVLATMDGNKVRAGKAVGNWGRPGLIFFFYHADPVIIEPIGKRGDAPAIDRLQSRRLLYLGQADGTAVVYDSCAKRAVYIPLASAVLNVARSPRSREPQYVPPC
jgi:hypothetical protein